MVVVVATALIGGIAAAVVSALVSALLLNYLFTPPLYTLTIAEPENVVTIALFVAVGIAVATVVDTAARRTAQARAARAEADALTVLAHSLLTSSDDTDGLLSSACRLFNASGAAVVRRDETGAEEVVASCGTPPASVEPRRHGRRDRRAQHAGPGRRHAPRVRARLAQRLRRLRQGDGRAPPGDGGRGRAHAARGGRPDPDGAARGRVARPAQPAGCGQGRRRRACGPPTSPSRRRTRPSSSRPSRSRRTGSARSSPTCST